MPGGIRTPLQRHVPELMEALNDPEIAKWMKTPEQGAATSVWAAVAKELEGKGGKYLDDVAEAEKVAPEGWAARPGYAPSAYDPPTEKRLWTESLKLVGLEDDA